jgi:hypothetical protein
MTTKGGTMRFIAGLTGAVTLTLLLSATAATAQSNDEAFKREVLARLQRIEDQLNQQSGGGGTPSGSFGAAVDLTCGYGTSADCSGPAKFYCKNQGFTLGLPAQDTIRNNIKYLTRVTCIR